MKPISERQKLVAHKTLPLFVRLGYEKVSFQDIATATGVPRTAIYRYYKTKREIFDAAILEVILEVRRNLARIRVKREIKSKDRLSAINEMVLKMLFRERDFVSVIFNFVVGKLASGEDMAERVTEFTVGLKHTFREIIEEGVEDGSLKDSSDAATMSDLLFANVEVTAFKMLLGVEADEKAATLRAEALVKSMEE